MAKRYKRGRFGARKGRRRRAPYKRRAKRKGVTAGKVRRLIGEQTQQRFTVLDNATGMSTTDQGRQNMFLMGEGTGAAGNTTHSNLSGIGIVGSIFYLNRFFDWKNGSTIKFGRILRKSWTTEYQIKNQSLADTDYIVYKLTARSNIPLAAFPSFASIPTTGWDIPTDAAWTDATPAAMIGTLDQATFGATPYMNPRHTTYFKIRVHKAGNLRAGQGIKWRERALRPKMYDMQSIQPNNVNTFLIMKGHSCFMVMHRGGLVSAATTAAAAPGKNIVDGTTGVTSDNGEVIWSVVLKATVFLEETIYNSKFTQVASTNGLAGALGATITATNVRLANEDGATLVAGANDP